MSVSSSSRSLTPLPWYWSRSLERIMLETWDTFARTAWSHRKVPISSQNCARLVQTHARKTPPPHENSVRIVQAHPRTNSAQSLTLVDAHAHASHKTSGTCRVCPAHKACAQNLPLYRQKMSQLKTLLPSGHSHHVHSLWFCSLTFPR